MPEISHELSLEQFSKQVEYALGHYTAHGFTGDSIRNVVISGLGGSGIGGRIARNVFRNIAAVPVEVYSDYSLPAYAGAHTLVVLSSYSGETEETLHMFRDAKSKGCKMLCITSGGSLQKQAAEAGILTYIVEPGFQPRQALGYSLTYNLLILAELCRYDIKPEFSKLLSIYKDYTQARSKAAEMLSRSNPEHKFVVVSDTVYEAAGMRFCQQIQENAKAEAFINVLPEANHNVFETYYSQLPTNFIFLYAQDNTRVVTRFNYLKSLLEKHGNTVTVLAMPGQSLSDVFEAIYITDWFSVLLSDIRGVDNMTVPNIIDLKHYLASH